jgi:hypothetical protein
MDLVWLVYAISLLKSIDIFFVTVSILSGGAALAFLFYRGAECSINSYDNEERKKVRIENAAWAMNHVKTAIKVLIPCAVILTFLPTERTAYIMVGAYATQKVAESGAVQETGGKVLKLINQKLDSYVQEGIDAAESVTEPKKKHK